MLFRDVNKYEIAPQYALLFGVYTADWRQFRAIFPRRKCKTNSGWAPLCPPWSDARDATNVVILGFSAICISWVPPRGLRLTPIPARNWVFRDAGSRMPMTAGMVQAALARIQPIVRETNLTLIPA